MRRSWPDKRRNIRVRRSGLKSGKQPSNASKEWSGKYIERIIQQHKKLDQGERAQKIQEKYKKTLGDAEERRKKSVKRLKE